MRDGRAEKCQYTVTEKLGDGTFVTIDRLPNAAMEAADHFLPLFRIQLLSDRRRAYDVSKDDSDMFAFAFNLTRCGADLFLKTTLGRLS